MNLKCLENNPNVFHQGLGWECDSKETAEEEPNAEIKPEHLVPLNYPFDDSEAHSDIMNPPACLRTNGKAENMQHFVPLQYPFEESEAHSEFMNPPTSLWLRSEPVTPSTGTPDLSSASVGTPGKIFANISKLVKFH